ncbi:TPA: hypothetical protein DF272_06660 [Candidatus Falkowbacteria bacterium]|nr:hypothetical protein [Candidatus Falkowbacteria bacterium]
MGYNMTAVDCPVCGSLAEYDCESNTVYCQSCISARHRREAAARRFERELYQPKPVVRSVHHDRRLIPTNDSRPEFTLNLTQLDENRRHNFENPRCECKDCQPKGPCEILGIRLGQEVTREQYNVLRALFNHKPEDVDS